MRWIGGGFRRPPRKRRTSNDRLRFQRHREMNIGESRIAVLERVVDGVAAHVARDLVEREAVVRPEREHDRVVGGGGLQLEVERAAELLAQREPERAVDAPAVGRVDHELHAAGLVEEPLDHDVLQGRHHAEHGAADREVVDDHRRRFARATPRRSMTHRRARVGIAGREQRRRHRHAAPTLRPTARRCAPAPRRARTAPWVRRRRRRGPARRRPRPAGSATSACRAGRCRPPSTRRPSPR